MVVNVRKGLDNTNPFKGSQPLKGSAAPDSSEGKIFASVSFFINPTKTLGI